MCVIIGEGLFRSQRLQYGMETPGCYWSFESSSAFFAGDWLLNNNIADYNICYAIFRQRWFAFCESLAKNCLSVVFSLNTFLCVYTRILVFPHYFQRQQGPKLSGKKNSLALEKISKHNKTSIVDHMENAHWRPSSVFKTL